MPTLTYVLNNQERRIVLADLTRIGRAEDNDVCVADDSLSRHHAVIRRDQDAFRITDQGSRNGILFSGQRVPALTLDDGMVFLMGDVEFVFNAEPADEAAPEAPEPAVAKEPRPEPAPAVVAPPVVNEAPLQRVEEPARLQEPAQERKPVAEQKPPAPEKPVAKERVAPAPVLPPLPPIPPLPPVPSGLPPVPAAVAAAPPAEFDLESQEAAVAEFNQAKDRILAEIAKVIVGQKPVLNEILVALFARGHCLMIGVPGLAKTLMVKTLAEAIDLQGNRIQFTPDLMPSDITGTDILEEDPRTGQREFRFHHGPLFTNLLLADEINRTPPKTQAALLEAMQERRVTAAGKTYDLPDPFMVMATQNPIEQEGTYPLPEAQLDRFMFCILLKYPSPDDERRVLLETTRDTVSDVRKALDGPGILRFQHLVRQVPVSEHVALYAMNLIRATRPDTEGAPDFIKRWVRWGAGTRAGQYLLLAAKAHVLMNGRYSVSCADIRAYALPVLRHRLFCNFAAASEGVSTDDIIQKILETVKEPGY